MASIEAQKGQIPSNISSTQRQKLEDMGFVIDKISDDLMTPCKFPSGWTTSTSEDPRHIYILDETEKKRVYMFVKYTFYDQYANLSILE